MKVFRPGPVVQLFYNQLVNIANAPAYQALNAGGTPLMRLQALGNVLPAPPAAPVDYLDRMFLYNICMPIYNAIVAAIQADAVAQTRVAGQPLPPSPAAVQQSQAASDYVYASAVAGGIDPATAAALAAQAAADALVAANMLAMQSQSAP